MKSTSTFLKNNITSLAIGRFDGIHLGHKYLFSKLDENGGVLVIDTLKANLTPIKFLHNYLSLPYLVYELAAIKNLSAQEFVTLITNDFPNLRSIVVGSDFRFGLDRHAGADDLSKLFKNVIIVNEFSIDNVAVHSRYIRNIILNGNVESVSKFLGRNYSIYGTVISGQGIGSKYLYSTINMLCNDFILPSEGVYITKIHIGSRSHNSITFLGHRVSTDGSYSIETYILEGHIKLEPEVCVEFMSKIRDNMYFDDLEQLKIKISEDIQVANKYFEFFRNNT